VDGEVPTEVEGRGAGGGGHASSWELDGPGDRRRCRPVSPVAAPLCPTFFPGRADVSGGTISARLLRPAGGWEIVAGCNGRDGGARAAVDRPAGWPCRGCCWPACCWSR
jgi:hypothetical protein